MRASQEMSSAADARGDWHGCQASVVAKEFGVQPEQGLSADEACKRLASHGPNRLAAAKEESGWQAFLRQEAKAEESVTVATLGE